MWKIVPIIRGTYYGSIPGQPTTPRNIIIYYPDAFSHRYYVGLQGGVDLVLFRMFKLLTS